MRILLIFIFLTSYNAYSAQENINEENSNLSVKLSVLYKLHQIAFLDESLENDIKLLPNVPYAFQVKLFFNENTLTLATDNLFDIGIEDGKGNSSYLSLNYGSFINEYEYHVYYEKYKGFYVEGEKDVLGDYFVFDGMQTKRYGFNIRTYLHEPKMVSINNKYSRNYKNLPDFFATLTYGALLDISEIDNVPSDPSIISNINNSEFFYFNNQRLITLSPFVGGVIRAATNGYYIESGLNLGYGVQSQEYILDDNKTTSTGYSLISQGFVSAGIIYEKYGILGSKFSFETVEPSVNDNEISIASFNVSVFYKIDF